MVYGAILKKTSGNFATLYAGLMLLCVLMLHTSVVNASNLSLLVNGKSFHTKKSENTYYNESNWGFGLQYEFARTAQPWIPFMAVSGFKDSHNEPSYYAGGGYMRRMMLARKLRYLHLDAGLIGFVMTRKDYKNGEPFLGALPVMSLGNKDVSVNVTYIPKVHPKMAELWFFQLKLSTNSFK
ncbi:MAG: hypothetical protein AMJ53_09985 [Gammaproteobacteria bacterium SG8_11]|nr:MAG: hypothetical protein AMJ53_09985 [Gammaproteobacteria bacterium SG8_11]